MLGACVLRLWVAEIKFPMPRHDDDDGGDDDIVAHHYTVRLGPWLVTMRDFRFIAAAPSAVRVGYLHCSISFVDFTRIILLLETMLNLINLTL